MAVLGGAEPAIVVRGLRKSYRTRRGIRVVALEGLDLDVPAGGVHGFLGPNGSGKTTSIRMLLGLVRADAGRMQIFGHSVPEQLPQVIGRVGAVVESPRFFPSFSGRRNLNLLAGAIGARQQQVDQVLEQTDLSDRANDRFSSYSLGMKQRLAIAATLLKSPELLIFDEPTNGLDPHGIHQIRVTMRRLASEGRTVLVSSHLLGEVEQIADTISIISRGRLLAAGAVGDVVGARAGAGWLVGVPDRTAAAAVLTREGWTVREEGALLRVDGAGDGADITRCLAGGGVWVNELTPVRADLESVFLELIGTHASASSTPPAPEHPLTLTGRDSRSER
jgi:ABC-2 type transport system ATP-binding protein